MSLSLSVDNGFRDETYKNFSQFHSFLPKCQTNITCAFFCVIHPNVEHSRLNVLPVPVGDSSTPCEELFKHSITLAM